MGNFKIRQQVIGIDFQNPFVTFSRLRVQALFCIESGQVVQIGLIPTGQH